MSRVVRVPSGIAVVAAAAVMACSPAALQVGVEPGPGIAPAPPTGGEPRGQVPERADEVRAVAMVGYTVKPAEREFSEARMRQLRVPAGFRIDVFARDLDQPRTMLVMENGDVYVAERQPGRVTLLRDSNGDGRPDVRRAVVEGLGEELAGVHGLATDGSRLFMVTDRELYVAGIGDDGDVGEPEMVFDDLPDGGQHPNRTMRFRNGTLYLSLGSTCNACPEPNEEAATMVTVNTQTWERQVFAEGLRNTIGFDWHPVTGEFWGMDHATDWRGDEFPREELNRLLEGRHYGWPFCAEKQRVDPLMHAEPPNGMGRTEFCQTTEPSVLEFTAHAAPMVMEFYRGDMFPAQYRNDAFIAMRGSWNRSNPVGYSVVRIIFDDNGQPRGFEDFITGWLIENGTAHFGRLSAVAVARDGALLVNDDHNGVIYRVTYSGSGSGS
jgi:glucose/arabinose dehydrogenase